MRWLPDGRETRRGLTAKGKEAIRRMNELGMVLDVSHINDKGFWDILELSDGHPVIASHSNNTRSCLLI